MTYSIDLRRKALWIKQQDHLSFEAVANVGQARVFRGSKQTKAKRTRNKPATKIDIYGSPKTGC